MSWRCFALLLGGLLSSQSVSAARLAEVSVLDRDHLVVRFSEGEVVFPNDGDPAPARGGNVLEHRKNWVVRHGALDLAAAAEPGSWLISSGEDRSYGTDGKPAERVFRKSRINGMAELDWDTPAHDWSYETPLDHILYLKLPSPLREGKRYELVIDARLAGDANRREVVFDSFRTVSEALHVNLVGYMADPEEKTADLHHWMGDGGARDYSAFKGKRVWLLDAETGERRKAGKVRHCRKRTRNDVGWFDFTASDVWSADFRTNRPGRYRIAVEGVGCSQEFEVGDAVYEVPFKVSVKGFYYMRMGEPARPDISPIPRQPRYIPGEDPPNTKIIITTMHPYHPEWKSFAGGDKWDRKKEWEPYIKEGRPENPGARGGHADAADLDRHLGHVSIVYDMLLPFVLTGGAISDDDAGIAESGNGIPDILDEARNEVDFWLSLRDGEGYSHGLNNPNEENVFYQAGTTAVAAWANAANAAMLADCFRIAGREDLKGKYLAAAVAAYEYAGGLPDPQLETVQNVGGPAMRGADFKITAAAYLFNLTGEERYEDAFKELCVAEDDTTDLIQKGFCQIWAVAGYLLSPHPSRYPGFRERLRRGVIFNAFEKEARLAGDRPSRRATNQDNGYNHTAHNVQRTMVAHRVSNDPRERKDLLVAMVREADWGLGRNPMNMVLMTTATTPLARLRSAENAYTSGRDDGVPGVHPGHTPYYNMDDWGGPRGMIMARPRWMAAQGYPEFDLWPRGETCFNTRWVWAHTEFTPQQTMRGKTALYGYLYGIGKR